MFVAQSLSGNVIAFMGDRPMEGRPWIFKIPRDKPWEWPEVKFLSNPIEIITNHYNKIILSMFIFLFVCYFIPGKWVCCCFYSQLH